MTLSTRPRIGIPIPGLVEPNSLVHPIHQFLAMLDDAFFEKKIVSTQVSPIFGIKGFGLISTFFPITSEDCGPLLQQIGPPLSVKCPLYLMNQSV